MDYEKKYKDAIERANIAYKDEDRHLKATIERIFPQLKEDNDVLVRKELISHFKEAIENIKSEEIVPHSAKILVGKMQKWITWLEKQVEEKSIDTVEPRFKIGDWIVYNRNYSSIEILYIYDIRDGRYYFNDNIHFSWSVKECDEKCRLWTIADAMDGDILAYKNDDVEWILIYKNIIPKSCDVPHDVLKYHTLLTSTDFYDSGIAGMVSENYALCFTPATKEQHDILFAKMHEAGYEWDFEKKELKKIKPKFKVGDTIYYNSFGKVKSMIVSNVVTDSTDNPMYEDANGNAVFEKDLVEQEPTWSREDEQNLNAALGYIDDEYLRRWLKDAIYNKYE